MVDVYLDDVFIGSVEKPREFVKTIREERRLAKLPQHLNIIFDKVFNEVYIEMSKGRARRPLIIVENGIPRLTSEKLMKLNSGEITWKELLDLGIIEYVDAAEEENCMIALYESDLTKEHTHLEVSPITILGICSSLIPYSNFGGSSRLIRGSKIQKQAIGIYSSNYLYRMDTDTSILHYSQVPVVNTFMHNIYNYKSHPAGQNVVIAMISFQGYNMQDAIILNKGSVERGFGRSSYFRPYVSEELRYSGGLTDEIVIGKTSPPRFLGELEEFSIAANVLRESSTSIKQGEGGRVDNIIITENEEGNRLVQIRIRDERIPEFGDKFASRHGQKGVIGAIIPEEDVPFTSKGVRPDILFSPHSIPGRMTISHLIEILAGKVGSLKGEYVDGTTFDAVPEV